MRTLPETMRAVELTGHGGLDQLQFRTDKMVPVPAPQEVLVRVGASSVNNTDINTRTSWYSDSVTTGITDIGASQGFEDADGQSSGWSGSAFAFPRIQGADICGEIVAVGDDVDPKRIGDRILADVWFRDAEDPLNLSKAGCIGSEIDGGFAEFTAIPSSCAHAISSELSDVELASFPCAYTTAENLVSRPEVRAGNIVLITGASGGVGSAAIQLCKRRGATVIALASIEKHTALRDLGADACFPRQVDDLSDALNEALGLSSVDVVLDPVCGPKFGDLIHALEPRGRYASCGAIAGPIVTFDARDLIYNDLQFFGATVAPKSVFENLIGYIERNEIRPVLAAVYDLELLTDAQEAFAAKDHIGKIGVQVS